MSDKLNLLLKSRLAELKKVFSEQIDKTKRKIETDSANSSEVSRAVPEKLAEPPADGESADGCASKTERAEIESALDEAETAQAETPAADITQTGKPAGGDEYGTQSDVQAIIDLFADDTDDDDTDGTEAEDGMTDDEFDQMLEGILADYGAEESEDTDDSESEDENADDDEVEDGMTDDEFDQMLEGILADDGAEESEDTDDSKSEDENAGDDEVEDGMTDDEFDQILEGILADDGAEESEDTDDSKSEDENADDDKVEDGITDDEFDQMLEGILADDGAEDSEIAEEAEDAEDADTAEVLPEIEYPAFITLESREFRTVFELSEYLSELYKGARRKFSAACKKLTDENGMPTAEFESWLIGQGFKEKLAEWREGIDEFV